MRIVIEELGQTLFAVLFSLEMVGVLVKVLDLTTML